MIEPTTAMAEIALVIDISGVCSSRETRRITPSPMNDASTNTNSCDQNSDACVIARFSCSCAHRAQGVPGPRVPHFALVGDQRAALDVVVQIELESLVLGERLDEGREIAGEEEARVERHRRREIERGQD